MALAALDMIGGLVNTTAAVRAIECMADCHVKRVVRLVTIYNPNSSDVTGTFRIVLVDKTGDEVPLRMFPFTVRPTDYWTFGTLGAFFIVPRDSRLEIVLDAAPDEAIEYTIHYAEAV